MIAVWIVAAIVAFPFQSKLQALASDESDAFQDNGAESTRVDEIIDTTFAGGSETTAVVLYTSDQQLTEQQLQRTAEDIQKLCDTKRIPDVVRGITPQRMGCGDLPPISYAQSSLIKPTTDDLTTQLSTVWTKDNATETVVRDVTAMRSIVPRPDDPGMRAYVTGEAGFAADQSLALEGIDETLLAVTLALVLVLLLLIYRSPAIAIVPIVVVSVAYLIAAALAYAGAQAGLYQATGQATAILIVLMFGAGTDYCLLLLARYREELANGTPDAMPTALKRTAPAIVSAGGIVVVVMLVLGVADYNATRWMGPVLAIGTAVTVLAGVTLLPAILAALPERAFTRRQKPSTLWPRIGHLVRTRPLALGAAVLAVLLVGSLGNLKDTGTLGFADQFRTTPESVEGLYLMQEKFPPGQSGPVDILVDPGVLSTALPLLGAELSYSIDLVGYSRDSKRALVRVTLNQDPFAATAAIPILRENARKLSPGALVGGPTAEILDSETALSRDAKLIVPLALALVFLIVAVLLRSLIAPIYVIATVIVSYLFALGVSQMIFSESDPAQPLFTFLFLVALGVDYNVFLLTRIKEAKRAGMAHEDAVIHGLERTGGVITSAGLILAGTFCTLLATELQSLFQVGFTVALGLLVDTFLIRIFLVPSIALLLRSRAV